MPRMGKDLHKIQVYFRLGHRKEENLTVKSNYKNTYNTAYQKGIQ